MFKRIFLLLVTGYWLLVTGVFAMDVDLWNLPVPKESQILWKDEAIDIIGIKATATHLRCYLPAPEIVNFYKDILQKNNWQLKEESSQGGVSVFVFTRGDKFFYVSTWENPSSLPSDIYLVSSPADLAICKVVKDYLFKENIADDVPGKDFSDIPRYPGARRRMNVFSPFEGAVLMYEVQAQPKEVAQFYRQNLKAQGWQEERALNQKIVEKTIEKVNPQFKDKMAVLCFYRGSDFLLVNVSRAPEGFESEDSQRSVIIIARNIAQELPHFKGKEEE